MKFLIKIEILSNCFIHIQLNKRKKCIITLNKNLILGLDDLEVKHIYLEWMFNLCLANENLYTKDF